MKATSKTKHSSAVPYIQKSEANGELSNAANVAGEIATVIRQEIAAGAIAPGQRLVEVELTKRFSVSRGSIREALHRLVFEGICVSRHNQGISVRELGKKELLDMMAVHESLACTAVRLAIDQNIVPDLTDLRALLIRMSAALKDEDPARFLSIYPEFHDHIFQLSNNETLIDMHQRLILYVFRKQFSPLTDLPTLRKWQRDHRAIVDAMAAGNSRVAESAMSRHIRQFTEKVRSADEARLTEGKY